MPAYVCPHALSCIAACRMRRHLEAQRNYQARLGAVKAALDAWLIKAQATYRRPPSRTSSGKSDGIKATKSAGPVSPSPVSPSPAVPASGVQGAAADGSSTGPAPTAAAAAPEAAAEEVRLLVSNTAEQGPQAGADRFKSEAGQPADAGRGTGPALQSPESMALDATTHAAVAAALLAQEEVGVTEQTSPRHRNGLLRFMRPAGQQNAPHFDPLPELASAAADADAAADTPGAAAAAGKDTAGMPHSSGAGGMGQVVQSLLAAQGKELPQGPAAGDAKQSGAAVSVAAEEPAPSWHGRWVGAQAAVCTVTR
jgi:hypothetical protein